MSQKASNLRSFTLIELIIVLALLAIISAVAVARFVDLTKKAYDVTENATIDALRTATLLYKAKYDIWPDCSDIELFQLLENPPPYLDIEHSYAGSCPNPRDGKIWCLIKFAPGWPCAIQCPHTNTESGGVMRAWYYYSGKVTTCVPCTGGVPCTPGSICEMNLSAGGHHI